MKKRCFPITAGGIRDGIKTTDEYQGKNRCHHEALINVSGNPKSTTRISACIEATCNDDNAEPAILSAEALSFSILPNLSMADAKVGVSRSTSALGGPHDVILPNRASFPVTLDAVRSGDDCLAGASGNFQQAR